MKGAEAPAGSGSACRGLCLATTDPPHSCEVEAMVELMTVRLAELVSARLSELCKGQELLLNFGTTFARLRFTLAPWLHTPIPFSPNAEVTAATLFNRKP
jgi:hypothetical protein